MAYAYTNAKGKTYFLHHTITGKPGKERTLYFFKKEVGDGALDAIPEGRVVSETKNGLPVLKKA